MRHWGKAAFVVACIAGPANAQHELAQRFGMREYVEQASLSPDGSKLAFVHAMDGQASAVMLLDLAETRFDLKGIVRASARTDMLSRSNVFLNEALGK